MTTIVTRAGKGSPLTHDEGDANFTNLNNDKIEGLVSDTTPQLGGDLDLNGSVLSVGNTGATSVLQAAGGADMLTTSRGAGADTGKIALTTSTTTVSLVSGVGNLGLTTPTSFNIVLTAPSAGIDISGATSGIIAAPRLFFSETTADTDRTDEHQLYAKADNELYWKKDGDTEVAISTSGGGVNDHGGLTGLTDDDHVRYSDIQTVGAGAPGSTPSREGNIGVDTTADIAYIAIDTTGSGDWQKVNQVEKDTAPKLGAALDCNGYNLTDVQSIVVDASPDTDHECVGMRTAVFNAGAIVAQFDIVNFMADGKFDPADASAELTSGGMLALAMEAGTDGNPIDTALPNSFIRDDTWAWTIGSKLYIDTATAGAMTHIAPVDASAVVRVVGYAVATNTVYFNPDSYYTVNP